MRGRPQWLLRTLLLLGATILLVIQSYHRTILKHFYSGYTACEPTVEIRLSSSSPRALVDRVYRETYQKIEQACTDTSVPLHLCLQDSVTEDALTGLPWWFLSLLRDIKRDNGLGGFGDRMSSKEVEFCAIEMVEIQQWREIFKFTLNNRTHRYDDGSTTTRTKRPKFVFLQDPLERLLAGYLKLCSDADSPDADHCEPTVLFNHSLEWQEVMEGSKTQKHEAAARFELYMDTLPFLWKADFIPQSLYCNGLFRSLGEYDHVGTTGNNFYKDLRFVQDRYGNRFARAVEKVFQVERHLQDSNLLGTLQSKTHLTAVNSRVKEFYTPRSIRRALEYFSIDYVTLGLQIPNWVEEILHREEMAF